MMRGTGRQSSGRKTFSMSDGMPPDPFRMGIPDLGGWGASCYSMFTALMSAGFTEDQALRFVADLTAKLAAMPPIPPQPS